MKLLSVVAALLFTAAAPALADDAGSHAAHHAPTDATNSSSQGATAAESGMMRGCPMKGTDGGKMMMQNGSMSDGMMMHPGGQIHDGNAMQCPMMKNEVPSKPDGTLHHTE